MLSVHMNLLTGNPLHDSAHKLLSIALGDMIMCRIFKTRTFSRWSRKAGVRADALSKAVDEMTRGLIDADLGGYVFKKRVPVPGRGKRGGARTIVGSNRGDRWFFLYGFERRIETALMLRSLTDSRKSRAHSCRWIQSCSKRP